MPSTSMPASCPVASGGVPASCTNAGSLALVALLAENVRVIVRDTAKLPTTVRKNVQVVEGSHGDPAVVERAFCRADAVFWLVPPDAAKTLDQAWTDFSRPAAEALRWNAVPRVVSITAIGRGTPWRGR